FTYRVSAINSIGTSSPSNTASAITQSATDQLTVKTQSASGRGIAGLSIELKNSTGQLVASGFTPATFTLKNSAQYTVGATSFSNYTFDHWLDTGSSVNPRPISISSNTQITAVYRDTGLTLSPTRGPVGTIVSVTGIAFSNNHQVTLTWDGTT